MNGTPLCDLALWIRRALEGPFDVDPGALDFLEATLGTRDPAASLTDPEGSEAASFIELLFFPAVSTRLDFEAHWGDRPFSPAQVTALAGAVCRQPVTALLRWGPGDRMLPARVPDFAVRAFIERLNIPWQPPARLDDRMRSGLPSGRRLQVRARLRHSRLEWRAERIDLLERFLACFPAAAADFDAGLEFLLQILDELAPGQQPFDFLIEKKLFFFQALCRQEALEERRRASTMELLMLQGARMVQVDAAECRAAMQILDRICIALYRRTRFFQRPVGL